MSKHYSTDNECLLTGGLWALIAALIIGGLSWLLFFDFWPTAIVVFVVALLIGLIIAFFVCKTRTVGRGSVDMRAVDLARAEMGGAAPAAVDDDGAADAAAAKADEDAKADADAKAAEAKAKADKKAKADAAKAKSDAKAKADKAAKAKADATAADDHDAGEVGEAKPELLTEARGGKADDLKLIKGVGPKLEKDLNAAGVYHFDQIANWTKEEVYWADNHLLDGFKGRVSRDNWVPQAKELAK